MSPSPVLTAESPVISGTGAALTCSGPGGWMHMRSTGLPIVTFVRPSSSWCLLVLARLQTDCVHRRRRPHRLLRTDRFTHPSASAKAGRPQSCTRSPIFARSSRCQTSIRRRRPRCCTHYLPLPLADSSSPMYSGQRRFALITWKRLRPLLVARVTACLRDRVREPSRSIYRILI